jgi:stage IV sporulation protein FB
VKKYIGLAIFAAMAALVVYTRGFEEAAVFFSALFVHEAFHILAAAGLGYQINSFGPGAFGLRFGADGPQPGGFAGAFIYLSGPLANIALAGLVGVINYYGRMPLGDFVIFYNLILAAVNLIPAYPMDAARALTCLLEKFKGSVTSVRIVSVVSYMVSVMMMAAGILIVLGGSGNMILPFLSLIIAVNTQKEKNLSVVRYLKNIKIAPPRI